MLWAFGFSSFLAFVIIVCRAALAADAVVWCSGRVLYAIVYIQVIIV
jgi:hypothetical protein